MDEVKVLFSDLCPIDWNETELSDKIAKVFSCLNKGGKVVFDGVKYESEEDLFKAVVGTYMAHINEIKERHIKLGI